MATPQGKALRDTLGGLVKDFAGWLKGAATPENITKFVDAFVDLTKAIGDVTQGLVGGFGEALKSILEPLDTVMWAYGGLDRKSVSLGAAFRVVGKVLGYIVGIFVYGIAVIVGVVYLMVEAVRVSAEWIGKHWETIGPYFYSLASAIMAPIALTIAVVGAVVAAVVVFVYALVKAI